MKPLSVSMGFDGTVPALRCVFPSKVEDRIWEAVQDAIAAGWTPEQFKREAAAAWEHELKDAAKHAVRVLRW